MSDIIGQSSDNKNDVLDQPNANDINDHDEEKMILKKKW